MSVTPKYAIALVVLRVVNLKMILVMNQCIRSKYMKNYKDNELIREQRCLQISPLLNDLKSELGILRDALDPAKELELLKVVNYALKEYPCILHCLEDGIVDLSNNCCEKQIRRIAKYRNNSLFVGSLAADKRFARLQSDTIVMS